MARPSFAPAGASSTMPFRRTSSWDTFPTTAPTVPVLPTPESAWHAIGFADLSGNPIAPGVRCTVLPRRWAATSVSIPTSALPTSRTGTSTFSTRSPIRSWCSSVTSAPRAPSSSASRTSTSPPSRKLRRSISVNAPTYGQTAPNCYIAGFDGPDGTNFNVPRTNFPNLFYVNQEVSSANSIYNALQASLQMNSWHGLFVQANYAWSHAIDNASDLEDFIPNAAQPNNSWNTKAERGNSSFDIRQRFSINFSYQLPKFDGEYAKLKNGWGIDGVVNLQDRSALHLELQLPGRLLRLGRRLRPARRGRPDSLRQLPGKLPRPHVVRRSLHLRQHHGHLVVRR